MKRLKKALARLFHWERLSQAAFALGAIPTLILWACGKAERWGVFFAGLNMGSALYSEFAIRERRRTQRWMEEAMRRAARKPDFEEMLNTAKHLVEARIKAADIDPDRN